jgi:hypothetical protein
MRRRKPLVVLVLAAATLAGCGGTAHYANLPRPPAFVTLTSAVAHGHVLVSPSTIGAGPVMLIVANQTLTSQQVTVSRPAPLALDVNTGPINPGATATLQINLRPGSYVAQAADPRIVPTQILVGPPRPSAKSQLLLP